MTNILGMQVEVPFVPASERKPNILDERVEDTIVIVGHTRAKKRKRNAVPKAVPEQHGSESPSVAGDEGVDSVSKPDEMATSGGQKYFDFSAVSNILDDDPDNEAEDKQTKQKRLKKQAKDNKSQGPLFAILFEHIHLRNQEPCSMVIFQHPQRHIVSSRVVTNRTHSGGDITYVIVYLCLEPLDNGLTTYNRGCRRYRNL